MMVATNTQNTLISGCVGVTQIFEEIRLSLRGEDQIGGVRTGVNLGSAWVVPI